MPPFSGPPKSFIMREPKTASASPRTIGAYIWDSISGAYWPSPCSSTTTSNPCSYEIPISRLLVAAVAEIFRVFQNPQLGQRSSSPDADGQFVRGVLLASSNTTTCSTFRHTVRSDSLQHLAERRQRVVSNDEDADALAAIIGACRRFFQGTLPELRKRFER